MRVYLVMLAVGYATATGDGENATSHWDLRAVTILESPFMMLKKNHANLTGFAKCEGFIVDLISEVAERAGFHYQMYLVEDGRYGARQPDGSWSGMVGDLIREEADIAVAPLATTLARSQVIDFSETFMEVPLTLLVHKGITVNSLEELLDHPTLQYGVREGGMVADAMQSTHERPYSQMWAQMSSFQPSTFFAHYAEGIERVRNDRNFSIIMDKPAAEYVSHNTACDTETQLEFYIGNRNASYAFGLSRTTISQEQKSSINDAIKTIIDDGTMETFRSKWWRDNCPVAVSSAPLQMFWCILPLIIGLLLNN